MSFFAIVVKTSWSHLLAINLPVPRKRAPGVFVCQVFHLLFGRRLDFDSIKLEESTQEQFFDDSFLHVVVFFLPEKVCCEMYVRM